MDIWSDRQSNSTQLDKLRELFREHHTMNLDPQIYQGMLGHEFSDLPKRKCVRATVSALHQEGTIRRLARGLWQLTDNFKER